MWVVKVLRALSCNSEVYTVLYQAIPLPDNKKGIVDRFAAKSCKLSM